MGNVGAFVAHSLAGIPNRPPITLLLKGYDHLKRWERANESISLTTHGMTEVRHGYDVEVSQHPAPNSHKHDASLLHDYQSSTPNDTSKSVEQMNAPQNAFYSTQGVNANLTESLQPEDSQLEHQTSDNNMRLTIESPEDSLNVGVPAAESSGSQQVGFTRSEPKTDDSIIYQLIVATKAPATAKAIHDYAHRLTRESTILFLQNGMGVIDEVNETVFPEPSTRPHYMIGVNSHGLKQKDGKRFSVVHAGEGTIALGIMPKLLTQGSESVQELTNAALSSRYLLRTMTRTPVFVAVGFQPTDLLQYQLDKLAVNAVINPLTAVLDMRNGAIVSTFHFKRVMRMILAEVSIVFRSLPELQNVPNVNMRFDTVRLEHLVYRISETTADNNSSMLQDVLQHQQTEIDYINGYIIKRGEELGVHCVINYMLMHMLKGKSNLMNRDRAGMFSPSPFSNYEGREEQ